MSIDLSTVVSVLAPILLAVTTAAIPIVVQALLKRFGVANSADLAAKLDTAATAAAGEAYRQAVLHGHDLTIPAGQNAAIALGANYLLGKMPDALKAMGITPESAASMVAARLGTLMSADNSISVPKVSPVTVTTTNGVATGGPGGASNAGPVVVGGVGVSGGGKSLDAGKVVTVTVGADGNLTTQPTTAA
jgi:hypothetical protein